MNLNHITLIHKFYLAWHSCTFSTYINYNFKSYSHFHKIPINLFTFSIVQGIVGWMEDTQTAFSMLNMDIDNTYKFWQIKDNFLKQKTLHILLKTQNHKRAINILPFDQKRDNLNTSKNTYFVDVWNSSFIVISHRCSKWVHVQSQLPTGLLSSKCSLKFIIFQTHIVLVDKMQRND